MLDLDQLVAARQFNDFADNNARSKRNVDIAIRQNNKILLEAMNQSSYYITQRNKLGSSFEALLRSVGLGAGVLLGGPVGAATLSSIAGGVGRGIGTHLGNKIYGEAIDRLSTLQSDHKYTQLVNYTIASENKASQSLIDEFYKQSEGELNKTIQDIGQ